MNTENENRNQTPDNEEYGWGGLIIILLFSIGIPILGVLYNLLFSGPAE